MFALLPNAHPTQRRSHPPSALVAATSRGTGRCCHAVASPSSPGETPAAPGSAAPCGVRAPQRLWDPGPMASLGTPSKRCTYDAVLERGTPGRPHHHHHPSGPPASAPHHPFSRLQSVGAPAMITLLSYRTCSLLLCCCGCGMQYYIGRRTSDRHDGHQLHYRCNTVASGLETGTTAHSQHTPQPTTATPFIVRLPYLSLTNCSGT